jgi:hypothetical protein
LQADLPASHTARAVHPFRLALPLFLALGALAVAGPQPVPRLQVLPLPRSEMSFQREGVELAGYHFGRDGQRPFVYPLNGPSGRPLTRMGHPRDPQSHSHHNSVWLSHQSVNGVNFWEDGRGARIAHERIDRIEDGDDAAFVETTSAWLDKGDKLVLRERRRTGVHLLENGEWLLIIDTQLEARDGEVTLGQSAFGLMAVRVAKTIGVRDGGGTIRNSEGGVNEAGCFRKPARWVDYSGPITNSASEGVTLFDHPQNLNHPVPFHVRDDGWMGASLTLPGAHAIRVGEPLRLRYAVYVHAGVPPVEQLEKTWAAFSKLPIDEFRNPR